MGLNLVSFSSRAYRPASLQDLLNSRPSSPRPSNPIPSNPIPSNPENTTREAVGNHSIPLEAILNPENKTGDASAGNPYFSSNNPVYDSGEELSTDFNFNNSPDVILSDTPKWIGVKIGNIHHITKILNLFRGHSSHVTP